MPNPRADILDLCGVRDVKFWPLYRQELSRVAGGTTQAKDFGTPLWQASFTTSPRLIRDAQALEAALISLGGSLGSFLAHDVRRPYPAAHADGVFSDTGQIMTLYSGDAYQIRLDGLPVGFTLTPGDYFSFEFGGKPSRSLHMITGVDSGSLVADASGRTGVFRVAPHIPPSASEGAAVTFKKPPCEMTLEPGQQPPDLQELVAVSQTFTGLQTF